MFSKRFLITVLFFSFVSYTNCSHFLGGTINWRIQNSSTTSTSVSILITQTYSWVYTPGKCENGTIASNQPVPSASGVLTCTPSCPAGFGTVDATPGCTDVSPLNGIAVGQRSDIVTIPDRSDFSIVYASNAWGGLTLGAGAWSITSRIKLQRRSDNGMFNNAPIATIMSPINIQVNAATAITVPVSDPDGDIVRCRWATAANGVDECGTVCPPGALPAGTVIYQNCTVVITGTAVGNRYAVALMVSIL